MAGTADDDEGVSFSPAESLSEPPGDQRSERGDRGVPDEAPVPLFRSAADADAAMAWWSDTADDRRGSHAGGATPGTAGGPDTVPRQHPSRTDAFFAAARTAAVSQPNRTGALEAMPPMDAAALRFDLADTSDEEAAEAWPAQGSGDEGAHGPELCPTARRGLKRAAAFERDTTEARDARRKARRANLRFAGDQRIRSGAVLTVCGVTNRGVAMP